MAGKIRKTAGVLLLIAALILIRISSGNVSAKDTDFRMNGNVLVKYTGNDETISIPDYVKVIGEEAFYDNDSVKKVEISDQVEEIRYHAFYGCDNLVQVDIGDCVQKIGNAAFADCDQLEKVSIGAGVTEMGNGVFSGCPLLSKLEISKDNDCLQCKDGVLTDLDETHLYEMLNGCITSAYDMPDTIESISKYAFWGCSHLEYVDISAGMKQIPAYAFSNCRELNTVTIPYSVTEIGAKAFENCSALQAIEIPGTVKTIHETAFDGCGKLQIEASPASYAETFALEHEVTSISQAEYEEVRDSVLEQAVVQHDEPKENEEENAEDSDTQEDDMPQEADTDEMSAGDSSEEQKDGSGYYNPLEYTDDDVIGQTIIVSGEAVVFIDNTKQPVYRGDLDTPLIFQNETDMTAASQSQPFLISDSDADQDLMRETQAGKGLYIPKYTVVDEMIANQAYYGSSGMDSYEFPEGITEIGDFSFARSSISSVDIPDGVTQIGYGAFYHCDQLYQVSIPDTVTQIEPYAFEKTPWLENWKTNASSDFLIVGDGILLAYRGSDSKIQIPEGVKVIAPNCFEGHAGIVTVSLSSTVQEIGEEAFLGCSNLATVNGCVGLTKIADRAFAGCPISTIKINEGVTQIGARAFDLSGTVRNDDLVAVDFKGTVLPTVSYEKSTTRLYHPDYRAYSFEGVGAAIVPNKHVAIEGTVLDPYVSGFRGFICTWYEDAPEGEKSLIIIKSTVPVTNTEDIEWPTEIRLYGTTYPVAGVLDTAFSYYENTDWIYQSEENGQIQLSLHSTVLTHPELSFAALAGNTEDMTVVMADDLNAEQNIRTAYEEMYQADDQMLLHGFRITAETELGIPITGFGTNPLEITVTIPEDMRDGLTYMMCLDEDGQLEAVHVEYLEQNGVPCIRFYASHLSAYAFCSFPGTVQAQSSGALDDSPDTGDFSEPKLLLCIGMAAAAFILILWKTPGKKRAMVKTSR